MNNFAAAISHANARISSYIRETPLTHSIPISKATGANIYLKCEHLQLTGSFKLRGSLNKLLGLTGEQKAKGVVTASSGNHGAAMAYGLRTLNIKGKIFVPENVSPAKLDNIKNYHDDVALFGNDCVESELHAIEYARARNMVYVSPYNDLDIIHGQGTIGKELLKQHAHIDAVFVPIGGGGLISGIAGFIKSHSPHTKIIGCLPANSPVMANSIQAGKIIDMPNQPTLSDATAGGIEPGAITFPFCQQWVDDYALVTEQEIKLAITNMVKLHRQIIEGASGVALAACINAAPRLAGKNIVAIMSGGNISFDSLKSILADS